MNEFFWLFQSSLVPAQKHQCLWCPVGEHRATQLVSQTQSFLSETSGHKGCLSGTCCLLAYSNNDDIRNLPGLQDASSRSVTRTTEASSIGQWPSRLLFGFCSRASDSSSVLVCPPFSPAGPHYPGSCEWVYVAQPWLIKLSEFFLFLSPGWLILFEISQCF